MLTETKVKISKRVDDKLHKSSITYLTDSETLIDALAETIAYLDIQQNNDEIEDADIISCKQSSIKEVATQFDGDRAYIAALKDIWVDETGNEKSLRYKVMLRAADLTECNHRVQELSREGYDMQIESLTEVEMKYLHDIPNTAEQE